jgi:hypothetical protein
MEIPHISHIKKIAYKATANLLTVKSAGRYEAEYQKFIKWWEENKINEYLDTKAVGIFSN